MTPPRATANPDQLEAQARRLRVEADALEQAVCRFDRAARGAQWQGRAAQQFQSQASQDQGTARQLASDLRQAAQAMDAGAAEIRRYLASLKKSAQPTGPR